MASATSTFGTSLRVARELSGLSLADVAARTNVPIAALEKLERDDVLDGPPQPYILWQLAPLYGVEYRDLMIACGNLIVKAKP